MTFNILQSPSSKQETKMEFNRPIVFLVICYVHGVFAGFVDIHNEIRRNVTPPAANMKKIQWSDELALVARTFADKCKLGHNSLRSQQADSFHYVGENTYYSSHNHSEEYIVKYWAHESRFYHYQFNNCSRHSRCLHYTQVVWADTEYIGCAQANCGSRYIVICNYGPGGNLNRNGAYKTGTPCSMCPTGYACEDKLCTPSSAVDITKNATGPEKEYVDAHNEIRRGVHPSASNMREIKWSPELAAVATSFAKNCTLHHNSLRSKQATSFSYVGENIYYSSKNHSAQYHVNYWANEVHSFNYTFNNCSKSCGHYTQIVWADSEYIGCGQAHCGNRYFVVCNYGPGGNYRGEIPYSKGDPCSKCPHSYICDNKLCKKDTSKNNGHSNNH